MAVKVAKFVDICDSFGLFHLFLVKQQACRESEVILIFDKQATPSLHLRAPESDTYFESVHLKSYLIIVLNLVRMGTRKEGTVEGPF